MLALTDRDRWMCEKLFRTPFLTPHQILTLSQVEREDAFTPRTPGAKMSYLEKRLSILKREGLVQSQLTIIGGRIRSYFFLSRDGVRAAGQDPEAYSKVVRRLSPAREKHTLDTNEVLVALLRDAKERAVPLSFVLGENAIGLSSGTGRLVRPDGTVIYMEQTQPVALFIEMDESTEPLTYSGTRDRTSIERKFREYQELGKRAREKGLPVLEEVTVQSFRVAFVTQTPERAKTMTKALEQWGGKRRYLIATMKDFYNHNLWTSPIWRVPGHGAGASLLGKLDL